MKDLFLFQVWVRIKDLTIKLISVKGTFFITATIVYFQGPSLYTFLGFILAGSLFISFREAGKWKGILEVAKKNTLGGN